MTVEKLTNAHSGTLTPVPHPCCYLRELHQVHDPRSQRVQAPSSQQDRHPLHRPRPAFGPGGGFLSYPGDRLSSMASDLLDYRPTPSGLEPECEVLVDGAWCEGFVRGWYRYADGWHASVQYSAPAETRDSTTFPSNHLATFPTDQIRQTEVPQ